MEATGSQDLAGRGERRSIESVSKEFKKMAQTYYSRVSPLYERFSTGIAQDSELLDLATFARKNQATHTLFFAAVRFLLLKGAQHPLASFFADISHTKARDDLYPAFRSFFIEHMEEIREIISGRTVQVNVLVRSAFILPAFNELKAMTKNPPIAMIEIGASAGLNLLWDH